MRPTEEHQCEVIIKTPGKKSTHSYLPVEALPKLKALLNQYSESEDESVDWTVVAGSDIAKYGEVGIVLRGARFRENMSQKELAKQSGISQENISRIENGKRPVGEKVAKKLAKPLKINYKLLLEECA
jgi:ribosome-binding protein aMBF1 (putative translation factor)